MKHKAYLKDSWRTAAGAGLLLLAFAVKVQAQQALLDAETHPKFIQPMPDPPVIDATNGGLFNMSISEFYQDLGLRDPGGNTLLTRVWGYNGYYPGPTIVAMKDVAAEFYWHNDLLDTAGNPLPHLLPVDSSVHWALNGYGNWQSYGVPVVTHLHGGHTESASDGLPEAWYTPGFTLKGNDFVKGEIQPYHYANDQEAATLWYHDHALGITRLNVQAGLAGFYLLRDPNENALIANNQLPSGPYEHGIVIQDRMFTADGQLYFPSEADVEEPEEVPSPSVLPEFFGDFILVNGMAWPVMEVEPRAYRLRFLNGSDSRFYNLSFQGPVTIYQVGTDDGLLPSPVKLNSFLIAPGERNDMVVDFSSPGLWGKTVLLNNNARTPYPGGDTPGKTTREIMAFRINLPFDTAFPSVSLPATLRAPIQPLVQNGAARQLILFEGEDEYGRLRPQLGTAAAGILMWDDAITENPMVNDVETWEVYNLTEDAHPIHLHLVTFQILDRQKFTATVNAGNASISNIKLVGQPVVPMERERGWKDIAVMYPGEVTRIRALFDLEGLYVWHCHILSHEDHEMMRPFYVGSNASRMVAGAGVMPLLKQNEPNPARESTTIHFRLEHDGQAVMRMYDATGSLVRVLVDGMYEKGTYRVDVETGSMPAGIYLYSLQANGQVITRKLMVQ